MLLDFPRWTPIKQNVTTLELTAVPLHKVGDLSVLLSAVELCGFLEERSVTIQVEILEQTIHSVGVGMGGRVCRIE